MQKELQIEPAETEKTFYIHVNYYDGEEPWPMVLKTRERPSGVSDAVFTVKIPYRKAP